MIWHPVRRVTVELKIAIGAVLYLLLLCCSDGASSNANVASEFSFSVYALSRGKGVPEVTRNALGQSVKIIEQAAADETNIAEGIANIKVYHQMIGLEGETRLCVEFNDPEVGKVLLRQVRDVTTGVDLINVVVEPCVRNRDPKAW